MKNLVVLSGAGISAESGIPTFRDSNGLWEGYDVMQVATPEGWAANPELVLDFYNQRRRKALEVKPNRGHKILAELEKHYHVTVVTQNVDNLHERAGSSHVIHLHGSLFESRSTLDESLVYPIEGWELNMGHLCGKGSQLRPNIVWFGEMVPLMEVAAGYASPSARAIRVRPFSGEKRPIRSVRARPAIANRMGRVVSGLKRREGRAEWVDTRNEVGHGACARSLGLVSGRFGLARRWLWLGSSRASESFRGGAAGASRCRKR